MSEGISVPSVRPQYPTPPPKIQPDQDVYWSKDSSYGPLTKQDKKLLEEHCGYAIVWPPEAGHPFPLEALFVADMRQAQGNLSDGPEFFGNLMRFQQTRLRMGGDAAFSYEFLALVASKSDSPAAASFLFGGGKSPRYA